MRVAIHDARAPFEAAAREFLERDQANNTMLLSTLARQPAESGAAWWSALASGPKGMLACALRDRTSVLLSAGVEAAAREFGRLLRAEDWLGSIAGPEPMATACAEGLGLPVRIHVVLPLMALTTRPRAPASAPSGAMRVANGADFDLLAAWSEAFRVEARLFDSPESVQEALRSQIERREIHLWIDGAGAPACFAGCRPIPPGGGRVAPVYTPPPLRGRGYAQALVTEICRTLQERGAQVIFLFTDATNPTSNALYARIGFAPVGRHLHLVAERNA